MIRYSLEDITFNPKSVVTVGTFDGLHVAHRRILETLVEKARALRSRSVLITFKPHPQEILGRKKVELLTTEEERVQLIAEAGIDEICLLKFDRDFSMITAEDFLLKLILQKVGMHELVLGYNHTFGRGAEGTVEFARRVGERAGFGVDYIDAILIDNEKVSSSVIRGSLRNGNLQLANKMLGRPYSVEGYVIRGDQRGRLLGYPTANLKLVDDRLLIPSFGVYVVEVTVEGNRLTGLASLGVRPTFEDEGVPIVEVWIADFDRDIYGKRIKVSFILRLRDEMKFDSAEQLIAQMDQDKRMMNEFLVKTINKQR
ncbi:MAG: riboflavin biosynthesis protein RibF [Ignavibacteriae bacterium 37-53-5]|nr:MAG: riboflavin biosynthesis protein RibF [Ignavibacteriae bacterium 37-53-5]